LASLLELYGLSELRFTIDQNIQIRNVKAELLKPIYEKLKELGLNEDGYGSVADITACPGTDTCNLGISNSTDVALFIEDHIRLNYPELLRESGIKIKISGCMNSCGQHGMAHIGFHGSSIKTKEGTLPALQLLLGGGRTGGGDGRIAEKVIKLPSKRVLQLIDVIFNDYEANQNEEDFNQYYDRQGNNYFYQLLKPLADLESIESSDYIDWGNEEKFATAIGVGECAGVMIDLVKTLFFDASEKAEKAVETFYEGRSADAIYFAYSALVHAAKALLVEKNVRCNTQQGIITDFDQHFENEFGFSSEKKFSDFVLQINKNQPSEEFATSYLTEAIQVFNALIGDNGNKIEF
jgi:sulfite reductase (ferredoxin)